MLDGTAATVLVVQQQQEPPQEELGVDGLSSLRMVQEEHSCMKALNCLTRTHPS